ncbi:MAG: DUF4112 domain-containing protein [Micavibrio aeruginosavorus]|uniref:DUF4112 domain-containing protein n=1 Tax=Micavibrio aeruginosavorus TaxID=349221 RepID=A0A2W5N3T0_9BACT|nr:MAG: DUF4112 domain-containing protein [Micavibrio aeruginosavorus]
MHDNDILKLEQLADLLDNQFTIPGTDIRLGLDPILGLIPGIGDTASLAVSAYIIHKAHKSGVHPFLISRMTWNVFVDWLIGLVPFFGDIFDVGFKANRRNIALIKDHVRATRKYQTDSKTGNALFI